LGTRLDIKFANALEGELDLAETAHLQVFQPPEELPSRSWWLPRRRRAAGDLLALTDRRLLWITDREKGFRSRYGSIASYAPLGAVSHIALVADSLQVDLRGSAAWRVPVAPTYRQAVEKLAAAAADGRTLAVRMAPSGPEAHLGDPTGLPRRSR
jgi:hypothetical protein